MRTPRRCESLALLWSIACASRQASPTHGPSTTADTETRSEPRNPARAKRNDWGRPEIVQAILTSPTEVTLYFSEPVAPSPGFDPHQFRLSVGAHYSYPGYSMTYYYDVTEISDSEAGRAAFTRLESIDDAALRLVLSVPLDGEACAVEDSFEEDGEKGVVGLFLHFDGRDDVGIVDRDGNQLKDIAEAWVVRGAEEATYYGVHAHRIRALGPIRCEGTVGLTHTPRP